MDVSKRHETPGSEVKDRLLLTAMAIARESALLCLFPEPQFSQDTMKGTRWPLRVQCVALQERNPGLRAPKSLIMGSKHTCPLLQSETFSILLDNKNACLCFGGLLSLSFKAVLYLNILENIA